MVGSRSALGEFVQLRSGPVSDLVERRDVVDERPLLEDRHQLLLARTITSPGATFTAVSTVEYVSLEPALVFDPPDALGNGIGHFARRELHAGPEVAVALDGDERLVVAVALDRVAHPCGLGGDQALVAHLVDQQRLEQLRLGDRPGHLDERFVLERERPLGERSSPPQSTLLSVSWLTSCLVSNEQGLSDRSRLFHRCGSARYRVDIEFDNRNIDLFDSFVKHANR